MCTGNTLPFYRFTPNVFSDRIPFLLIIFDLQPTSHSYDSRC